MSIPDQTESVLIQAAKLVGRGAFAEAAELYSEWIRENPDCADAYLGRGRCSAALSSHDEAIDDFNAALDLSPKSAESLCARALSWFSLQKNDAGLRDLDHCLKLRPDLAEAYCARAAERLRTGQVAAALEDCSEAIRLRADFGEAYYQRHLAHAALGHSMMAVDDYEQARQIGIAQPPVVKASVERQPVVKPTVMKPPADSDNDLSIDSHVITSEHHHDPITAHVLFMDIVKSTQQSLDGQYLTNDRLNQVVMKTSEFRSARKAETLISLPTGDGMALLFLDRFERPLLCAIGIAKMLQQDPFCGLRMGIHTGVVFVQHDINGNRNATGPGINLAQRVMSCGDAGHILLSGESAELLRHLDTWSDKLEFLGEYRAKRDSIRIWNYFDGTVGNPAPLKAAARC